MRSIIISSFLLSLALITGCRDKNQVFVKRTGVEWAGLKGKVKSIITYHCAIGDSVEHFAVYRYKYNERGFLTEETDTIGHEFYSDKYFYNNDGLLAKHIFAAGAPFPTSVDTYLYSFSEGKRTCITRYPDSSSGHEDTSVYLYDKNGNELEYKTRQTKLINKYDGHGFLISSKMTRNDGETIETIYINDTKGRILKQTRSDGRGAQAHVYDKDGIEIQQLNYDSLGRKTSDYYTGYCEFDKNGNYLKSISFSPQRKDMWVNRRIIEYY